MQKQLIILFLAFTTIFFNSCDAILQNIQKSQQTQTATNQATGKSPKRAYTLTLPSNLDRILPDGFAPGDIMVTTPNPWGTRYKDYIYTDFEITTEYYKKGAPNWDGTKKNLIMDIVRPKNDAERKRPCFVFLFGGGFAGKFDDCTQEIGKGMAQKGYVVVLADYRVGYKNALLAGQCIGDFNTGMYPALLRSVQDARSIVRYLKANADRLGIDRNLIFVSGQSAGALTSIGLALLDNDNAPNNILLLIGGNLDPMNDNMQYDAKVAGIVSMAGAVIDPNLVLGKKINTPMNFIHGTCDELLDMYSGNPFRCSDKKSFPTVYGGAAIYEASKDNKNQVYFNMICNGSHSMSSIGYNKLIELLSDFTYSIIQGQPITGKKIIQAAKGVCNKPDICK